MNIAVKTLHVGWSMGFPQEAGRRGGRPFDPVLDVNHLLFCLPHSLQSGLRGHVCFFQLILQLIVSDPGDSARVSGQSVGEWGAAARPRPVELGSDDGALGVDGVDCSATAAQAKACRLWASYVPATHLIDLGWKLLTAAS
ncbi:hypothetical protein HBI77_199070 [Parastagonospora nodorum]|nr:hypothetical protein HBI76_229990 [Parastagonospora nodorum]KAH4996597.1 hypothetical protein HBI77_199070 [Parastagonospora nodorum]